MLEGTLESFSLPDIFQLLAFTKKSGCLRLEEASAQGHVYFREGQVYYAVSSSGRLALGRRLVGAGLVGTDELKAALSDQREAAKEGRGMRIGQILVREGAISDDTLETFVREQIQDAVFDLMRWSAGSFSFDMGEDSRLDEPIELSVSVENLIMEGSRRLEEWDAVARKIPSADAVVAMAAIPGDAGVEVSLKAEEWRLLTLVDGRRTVADLVEVFGQGEFHTCKVLYGMIGSGLVEVRESGEGPSPASALLAQHEFLRELEGDAAPARDTSAASPAGVGAAGGPTTTPANGNGSAPAAAAADDVDEPAGEPTDETPSDDIEVSVADASADDERGAAGLTAKVSRPAKATAGKATAGKAEDDTAPAGDTEPARDPEQRLTTDPSIDEDLVRRLIDGVKGL